MRLAVFDGSYLLHRTLRVEGAGNLRAERVPTGGFFGVLQSVRAMLANNIRSQRAVLVLDGGVSRRRLDLFPMYKANRRGPEEELSPEEKDYRALYRQQAKLVQERLPEFGIRVLRLAGREGDDVIGMLSVLWDGPCVVATDDKDLLQLVSKRVSVYQPRKGVEVTPESWEDLIGFPGGAERFLWYLAVVGDRSDNIQGVQGVGEVTMKGLLAEYRGDDLNEFAEHCDAHQRSLPRRVKLGIERVRSNLELFDVLRERFDDPEIRQAMDLLSEPCFFDDRRASATLRELRFKQILENYGRWAHPFRGLR